MRRATVVVGLIGFLAGVIGGAINWQICVPCLALFLGAGAAGLYTALCAAEQEAAVHEKLLRERDGAPRGVNPRLMDHLPA